MMKKITALQEQVNTKTLNLLLLSCVTAGIYPILWLSENYKKIDEITNRKTADKLFFILISVCVGMGYMLTGLGERSLDVLSALFSLGGTVLFVFWSFKAREAIQEYVLTEFKIDLQMNRFYTVIFNIYYINYCINDLVEVQRKNEILSSKTDSDFGTDFDNKAGHESAAEPESKTGTSTGVSPEVGFKEVVADKPAAKPDAKSE